MPEVTRSGVVATRWTLSEQASPCSRPGLSRSPHTLCEAQGDHHTECDRDTPVGSARLASWACFAFMPHWIKFYKKESDPVGVDNSRGEPRRV